MDHGGQRWTARDGGKQHKAAASSLILTCQVTVENDRIGRQTAIRPRPGSGQTHCPVENTGGNQIPRGLRLSCLPDGGDHGLR